MKIPSKRLMFAGVLCAAALLKVVHAYTPTISMAASVQAVGLPLDVTFNPDLLDAGHQQLYQSMLDVLDGYTAIPNDRVFYFSAVNNANGFEVLGWGGFIANVQPNANGNLVTLEVTPSLTSNDIGACIFIIECKYAEQYQVFADGTFQYVQSLDPLGLSGQIPQGMISL